MQAAAENEDNNKPTGSSGAGLTPEINLVDMCDTLDVETREGNGEGTQCMRVFIDFLLLIGSI